MQVQKKDARALISAMVLCLPFATLAASASAYNETGEPVQVGQTASHLQISGTKVQFSVEADHADVLSSLKALFVQANKQFDADSAVAGQITLKLTSQSLETVLASICKQTFIKYKLDASTGIYHFEQDIDAVKQAFARLDALSALMRQQLRDMGLGLPEDSKIDGAYAKTLTSETNGERSVAPGATGRQFGAGDLGPPGAAGPGGQVSQRNGGANGGRAGNNPLVTNGADVPQAQGQSQAGGGFGGGGGLSQKANPTGLPEKAISRGAGREANAQDSVRGKNNVPQVATPKVDGAVQSSRAVSPTFKDSQIPTYFVPEELLLQLLQADNSKTNNLSVTPFAFNRALDTYLKENNLIAINTGNIAVPVADVLAELGRQANVPILIDPMVPRGSKFRITLTLPACSLNEALNLVLPPAHLLWRTINNAIYVTPKPDFQIFYGESVNPIINYRNNQLNGQSRGQQSPGQVPGGPVRQP